MFIFSLIFAQKVFKSERMQQLEHNLKSLQEEQSLHTLWRQLQNHKFQSVMIVRAALMLCEMAGIFVKAFNFQALILLSAIFIACCVYSLDHVFNFDVKDILNEKLIPVRFFSEELLLLRNSDSILDLKDPDQYLNTQVGNTSDLISATKTMNYHRWDVIEFVHWYHNLYYLRLYIKGAWWISTYCPRIWFSK